MTLTDNYQRGLLERLADPEYAAGYLSACAEEGQDAFLLGLRDVAEAMGGVAQLADDADSTARASIACCPKTAIQNSPASLPSSMHSDCRFNASRRHGRRMGDSPVRKERKYLELCAGLPTPHEKARRTVPWARQEEAMDFSDGAEDRPTILLTMEYPTARGVRGKK